MPAYQIDISARGGIQTFVTEDLDAGAVITRLRSFLDCTSYLVDYTIDIKPVSVKSGKRGIKGERVSRCLYERDQICPLGLDRTDDTCLHCQGRGEVAT